MPQTGLSVLVYYVALAAIFFIGLVVGGVVVFFVRRMALTRQLRVAQRKALRTVSDAHEEAKEIIREGRAEIDKGRAAAEVDARQRRQEVQRQENRVNSKSETLDRKLEGLEQRERNLNAKEKSIDTVKAELAEIKEKQLKQLEIVSSMSIDEARGVLMERVEGELRDEGTRRLRDWEKKLREEADKRAQEILVQAIQRSASEIVSESTVVTVPLPSDEMKGRLIGREGRNIRALEQATGVDLIVDDTPEAVTLSSFDGVRREIARLALNKLILNGRIHPTRIEEVVAKTKEEVEASLLTAGEQAAYQVGVQGLRPELVRLLGRLKFRTSYGQNALAHSVEVGYIAGMIAAELGANISLAKRAGLLHDIGKAVDREVEGTHAAIGADLVKQWDKSPEVIQGISEHHFETGTTSFWGFVVSAADAISSARPGARRESLESYLKRLKALEDIADGFKGVEKSYAIQAGQRDTHSSQA